MYIQMTSAWAWESSLFLNLFQNVTDLTKKYFQEIFVEIAFYDRQYTDYVILSISVMYAFSQEKVK